MCGIFALLNNENSIPDELIKSQFEKGKNRGPEFSILQNVSLKTKFGFHRLAINGLNTESNQPIKVNNITLICNGEIYNYKELYRLLPDVKPKTDSDCEIIIHLYEKFGIEYTLKILDGVFAFVLLDDNCNAVEAKLFVARDPYGVRPLYFLKNKLFGTQNTNENILGFASELKVLSGLCNNTVKIENAYDIDQFQPGTYSEYYFTHKVLSYWKPLKENVKYHSTGFTQLISFDNTCDHANELNDILKNIQKYFRLAVQKRCSNTERPIACLLSGGLDSSLVAALVCEYHKKNNLPMIETYSIGLADSEDLKYAKLVAEHLGTIHTEIVLTEENFVNAIPEVICTIESYDTTSVRASIGNYLLGKYISQNSKAKVIFNGDGSDELIGGYLYMRSAPNAIEFDKECRRLLDNIYAFDVLRSDKCISSHGLEPRTPFLDRAWTQYYMSIPPQYRYHSGELFANYPQYKSMEKLLLRLAFSYERNENTHLLPESVLWRTKEAFSDGVSGQNKSLYTIIQEHIDTKVDNFKNLKDKYLMMKDKIDCINAPTTSEQIYYRMLFEEYYPGYANLVPYFWMPKYVNATDPSARTLGIYRDAMM
jgi:asparagine synthase (glutamine-hydrolysing)